MAFLCQNGSFGKENLEKSSHINNKLVAREKIVIIFQDLQCTLLFHIL